jgi:hypothetical protein
VHHAPNTQGLLATLKPGDDTSGLRAELERQRTQKQQSLKYGPAHIDEPS